MAFWKNDRKELASEQDRNESGGTGATEQKSTQAPGKVSHQAATEAPVESPGEGTMPEAGISERYGKVRSALGPGTVIQGKLSFDTTVRIDGKLSGEIFSSKTLVVGEQGLVDAQVEVANLVVMGSVRGTIRASESIALLAGASLDGSISTPSLSVAEGARLNGDCRMNSSKKGVSLFSEADQGKRHLADPSKEENAAAGSPGKNAPISGDKLKHALGH